MDMNNAGEDNSLNIKVPQKNVQPQNQPVPVNSGEDRVIAYERKLNTLRSEVATLDRERALLASSIEQESLLIAKLEQTLVPILKHEQSIVDVLKEISAKERAEQDIQLRRTHEQERWKHIEEWYAIEQEKWQIQEDLDAQKKRIEENSIQHAVLVEKENALRAEVEKIEIEEEKEKFHIGLNTIVANRIDTENKLYNLEEARKKALAQFDTITEEEKDIEKKESEVEIMLKNVHSLSEERSLAEERYTIEKNRHEIEEARWNIEDEMAQLGSSVVDSEKLLLELKQKEAEINAKLVSLEQKTHATPPLVPSQENSNTNMDA